MKDELQQESPGVFVLAKQQNMLVSAKIFTSKKLLETVDETSLQQVCNAASLPGAVGSSIAMPDMHMGYGFCVGGVSAYSTKDGIISPGAIGFDINCGVRVLTTNLHVDEVAPVVDILLEMLAESVPVGVGKKSSISLGVHEFREVARKGAVWALENGYALQEDIDQCEEGGCFSDANPMAMSQRAQARGFSQLGTLGAGNHFLEIQVVDEILDEDIAQTFGVTRPGQVVVMIHCGSRGVGHQVCTDYLQKIQEQFPDLMNALPEKNLAYAPLSSSLATDYIGAMRSAANFAFCNRQIITHHTRKAFSRLFSHSKISVLYDVAHNIAKQETHEIDGVKQEVLVHRKGATRAFPAGHLDVCEKYRSVGQPVLIPGSMGTHSYVLVGTDKAMEVAFGSSAHGAGRVLSRTQAQKSFDGSQIIEELSKRGIVVHAESSRGVAQEAPGVYKDVDEVIRVTEMAGIAQSVVRLRPLGVLKG